jgi:hypothetical protein
MLRIGRHLREYHILELTGERVLLETYTELYLIEVERLRESKLFCYA